jgi:molybdate transport system ATP-binding protein
VPTLLVTHDPQDVEALAREVVQLENGRVVNHVPGQTSSGRR